MVKRLIESPDVQSTTPISHVFSICHRVGVVWGPGFGPATAAASAARWARPCLCTEIVQKKFCIALV